MRDLGEQGHLLHNACDRGLRGIVGSFQGPAAHEAMEREGGTPGEQWPAPQRRAAAFE
jgi:hypothetical protein